MKIDMFVAEALSFGFLRKALPAGTSVSEPRFESGTHAKQAQCWVGTMTHVGICRFFRNSIIDVDEGPRGWVRLTLAGDV